METLIIPTENDFKRWVREAVHEYFENLPTRQVINNEAGDELVDRKQIAKILKISLVTLTDWVKRGLPCHKQRGRVYFIKTEVLAFIRENKLETTRISRKINI